ncbi:MAG: hypothetical protein KBT36_14325 [Kurthia sp.]|nr:hypothetical protein [Candidatus Kurthia equi]
MKTRILICVGLATSFFSCAINKTDKNKTTEETNSTKNEIVHESTESLSASNTASLIERKDFSQLFNFDYEPTFDQFGQVLPFVLEYSANGQTEKYVISGAKVSGQSSTNNSQVKEESKQILYNRNMTIRTYETQTTYKTQTKIVNKERYQFGPQSIYAILLCGLTILFAALAFTGHWQWIKNVFQKLLKFISNL